MNYVAFVIPAFFLFLAMEFLIARKMGKLKLFTYEGSIANVSIGIAERLLNLFITGAFYEVYVNIYEAYRLFTISNHWAVWILLILATDFVWYWYHRLGHEINILWGAHIVHHQSEDFNYSVSARITTLQAVVRNSFWAILPFIGFDPLMITIVLVIHGTYSFFTHTQLVGNLGWLEYVFITPAHHGVHHASNEKYLNKNYGDIFIFWDKLFGTFQKKEEEPVYGLTHPLKSNSFLWQHFHYYAELWEASRRSKSFWQVLKIIFGRPEILDQNIRKELEAMLLPPKINDSTNVRPFKAYINIQLILSVLGLFIYTLLFNHLSDAELFFGASLILVSLINCGALLEQQLWIFNLEVIRIFLLTAFLSYEAGSFLMLVCSPVILFCMIFFKRLERRYLEIVYSLK